MKKIFILYGVLAIVVIGLIIWRTSSMNFQLPFASSNTDPVATINDKEITLLLAKTDEERIMGLSNRESLDENTGMLFVFEEKSTHSFWMKNMQFPIDIIFIDDTKIVDIKKNAQPLKDNEDPIIYTSDSPANHVLEVNAGFVDKHNISESSTLQFENIQ